MREQDGSKRGAARCFVQTRTFVPGTRARGICSHDVLWEKKLKSLLNNPRLVCLHLFEILKGTHHAEHYVEIGAQIEKQCILLYSFCCVLSILNLYFCCPIVTHVGYVWIKHRNNRHPQVRCNSRCNVRTLRAQYVRDSANIMNMNMRLVHAFCERD